MNTDPSDMLKAYKGRAGIIIEMMAQRYPQMPRMCLVQVLTLSLILQFVLPSCKARKLLNFFILVRIGKKIRIETFTVEVRGIQQTDHAR